MCTPIIRPQTGLMQGRTALAQACARLMQVPKGVSRMDTHLIQECSGHMHHRTDDAPATVRVAPGESHVIPVRAPRIHDPMTPVQEALRILRRHEHLHTRR